MPVLLKGIDGSVKDILILKDDDKIFITVLNN